MKNSTDSKTRCAWVGQDPIYIEYHDTEWGRPLHDDRAQFEMLCLEGAQAGLSWIQVLRRREAYRRVFHHFDPKRCATLSDNELETILLNPGIIRNRLKVFSVRKNARAFLAVQQEFGDFDRYIWSFVGGKPMQPARKSIREVPARSPESDALSADLKRRGFSFAGSTIIYAHMQATGMVNDHTVDCWCYGSLKTGKVKIRQ